MTTHMSSKSGRFRRMIDLNSPETGKVVAWLEDDFHHFGVILLHESGQVVDVQATAARHPWSTCPGAVKMLRGLVGKPLVARASDIGALIDMRQQCTHLFDLAGLVLAHAANGNAHRRYEAIVEDREVVAWAPGKTAPLELGPTVATLMQDGEEVLRWMLNDQHIVLPDGTAGPLLQHGFRQWTESMPEAPAEWATVLRRAVMVATGRLMDLNGFDKADELGRPPVCFSYQSEQASQARNMRSVRDYSDSPEGMLSLVREEPGA